MKISIIFSMDAVVFDELQLRKLRAMFAEWHVIHVISGRMLVDAIIDQANFEAAQADLISYNPNIIGKWDKTGGLLSVFDDIDYLALLPPVISREGGVVVRIPRAQILEIHKFSGWAARSMS